MACKLRCGAYNNLNFYEKAEEYKAELLQRYATVSSDCLEQIIFFDEIDDNTYKNCVFVLTLCDELSEQANRTKAVVFDIDWKTARELYFALMVNRKIALKETTGERIRTYGQLGLVYSVCGGNADSYMKENEVASDIFYTSIPVRSSFIQNFNCFTLEIPYTWMKDGKTQKTYYTAIGAIRCPHAFINIGGQRFRVPRNAYLPFFSSSKIVIEDAFLFFKLIEVPTSPQFWMQLFRIIGLEIYDIINFNGADVEYYTKDETLFVETDEPLQDVISVKRNDMEMWYQLPNRSLYRYGNGNAWYLVFSANDNMVAIYS
jgi:hypothetical protein